MPWLKGLIIVMGALIVLGLAVVAITIMNRMGGSAAKSAEKAKAGFGTASLAIGAGCRIVETVLGADRLVVRTDGEDGCRRIHIIDANTGTLLGTLDVVP